MTTRATRLAWTLAGLTALMTVAGLVLIGLARRHPQGETEVDFWIGVAVTGIVIPWSVVGALVAARRPGNPIGWMFLLAALGMSVSLAANAYAGYSEVSVAGWPGAEWAAWLNTWLFTVSGIVAPVVLFLIFPDGRFLSAFWKWTTIAILVVTAAYFTGEALEPGPIEGYPELENPIGIEQSIRDAFAWFGDYLLGPIVMVFAISSLVLRFRRSKGEERAQIKWVIFAAVVACAGFLAAFSGGSSAGFAVGLFGLAATPIAAGIAILKYRLYEIDHVVNRTVVYLVVTGLLAGLYFGIVIGLQAVFGGLARGNDLAIAGSTLAVAALFRPARAWIQAFVDRRFYRSRYDAARTLETFSGRLSDEVDLDRLGTDLGAAVHETMQPAHVSLWLRPARVEHE